MGEKKDHLKTLSELSEKVMALANSIRRAEKDMESVWTDQVEMRDLQDVKSHMKQVEDVLCMLQEEVDHIESIHCRRAKEEM
jgi:hypothetical protein